MEKTEVVKELENILDQLSIKLKYGRGYFNGGLYRYKNEQVIYLNRVHSVEKHINILCQELKKFDLGELNINPKVRVLLENPEDN